MVWSPVNPRSWSYRKRLNKPEWLIINGLPKRDTLFYHPGDQAIRKLIPKVLEDLNLRELNTHPIGQF
jgi:hypothetical protein